MRDPALVLYAFCRLADDAVDEGAAPVEAVLHLQDRLDRAYAGRPFDAPIDRCLHPHDRGPRPAPRPARCAAGRAGLGREERSYDSLSQVLDYSARVAAVVGVMMCVLMGVRDRTGWRAPAIWGWRCN